MRRRNECRFYKTLKSDTTTIFWQWLRWELQNYKLMVVRCHNSFLGMIIQIHQKVGRRKFMHIEIWKWDLLCCYSPKTISISSSYMWMLLQQQHQRQWVSSWVRNWVKRKPEDERKYNIMQINTRHTSERQT